MDFKTIKRMPLLLASLGTLPSCVAPSNDVASPSSTEVVSSLKDEESNLINYLGRYQFEDYAGVMIPVFAYSCAGFEIRVKTKSAISSVSLNLCSFLSGQSTQFINLYIDDKLSEKIELTKELESVVVEGLHVGEHIIRINKLNEAQFSKFGYRSCDLIDADIIPIEKRSKRKMEVYGDSITCGYGNLASSYTEQFSMATEDGMQTYAMLCAEELDFDCNVISSSGLAMALSPFGSEITLKDIYATSDMEKPWEFSSYIPEYVLINIGTNDNTAYNSSAKSEKKEKLKLFKDNYLSMMKSLRETYGEQTKFICLANMMVSLNKDVNEAILSAISSMNEEYGSCAYYCTFDPDGKGAVSHPGLEAHKRNASTLAELIASLDEML